MTTHVSVLSANNALNTVLNVLNAGFVDIYTGPQPTGPDTAVTTQVKLARCNLASTAFAAAVNGSKTAGTIAFGNALNAGAAAWFRAVKSDGVTAVIDGSVGGPGSDMVINDINIILGGAVIITSWVVSMS